MIEISILELLYLVLIFFLVIVGTLLTLVLLRLMKILKVGVELAEYYNNMKQLFIYYTTASFVMKDKIFEYITNLSKTALGEEENQAVQNPTEK